MNPRTFRTHPEEPEPESISKTRLDSLSDDDDGTKAEVPSPKKMKKMLKRVLTIPIGDSKGPKSKGETYPPSDSWAWRKYGQKPIKGSPYPRGYYRCSSSKGCPAKKQVERSRMEPKMLIVTYAYDHNHSLPAKKSHSSAPTTDSVAEFTTPTSSTDGTTTTSTTDTDSSSKTPPEELTIFASHLDLELAGDSAVLLTDSRAWFDDVASTRMLESPICGQVEDVALTIREEDESLFGDLGELPECSTVFRHRNIPRSSPFQCGGIPG